MPNQTPEFPEFSVSSFTPPRPSSLGALLRAVGSLRLAVVLIALYAAALVLGTAVEKLYGTAAAQKYIYHAVWFVALNAEAAVNILAAVLARFPWRPKQTGFVVAHLGVVVLLSGCFLSWQYGSRAHLPLIEGQTARLAYEESNPDAAPVELDFWVRLREFRRKLDPGSAMASHYSSLVDFLDGDDPSKALRTGAFITLNAPVDFTDPQSGRTHRFFQSSFDGPFTPGEPIFDRFTGGRRDRDHVYRSVLSVNYDPGRWWKYAGSLMIVVGIVLAYYVRFRPRAENCGGLTAAGYSSVILFLLLGAVSTGAWAEEAQRLDWDAWRRLPAFGEGRVEPLDSFARKTVEAICGRDDPTLVGPGGRRRKYDAAELLFAWLVEPERWERVPFIKAADPDLRSDALGLPLRDADGRRPAFVSPGEVDDNPRLDRYLSELQLRIEKEGKDFRQSELDREVERLAEAYGRYRRLTFDADRLKTMPRRFFNRIRTAGDACRKLITDGQCIQRIVKNKQVRDLTVELVECRKRLIALSHKGELSREKLEPAAADFRGTAEKLADLLAGDADKPLAGLAAELRREAVEMHLALYDNGDVLRLVPALNPAALEENRKQNDDAPPWLAFQALIVGSDELLRGYPRPRLEAARTALAEAKAAYLDAQSPNRPANFADAMNRFADSLRSLAEEIEPSRRRLPLQHRDEPLLDATAYPPPGATAAEVFYNRLDPFFWSWLAGLVSSLFLLSAAGRWRRPAFWSGAAALVVSLGLVIAGLGLRAYITGLAPLTGMFESVVVVAAFVYALGLWLALLPCVGMGGTADWADVPSAAKRSSVGEQILRRRLFALAGAIVGTLALALAYYAPASVMRRNIGAAVPILRDNFWLVVHVVTIMAGYASAAIALIIGNVALGYYLFGRYAGRRTPPACATLAGFIYSAVKITVLLLAAGTILGALWADVSWGRFWGWDPKEVWALVSLLVYLWFLHARRVGLSGDFGMALTAVLGATVILFNWYGVNFILGIGLHAYATGAGGQWQVTAAVALQWFFLLAAAGRYLMERGRSDMPQAMEN